MAGDRDKILRMTSLIHFAASLSIFIMTVLLLGFICWARFLSGRTFPYESYYMFLGFYSLLNLPGMLLHLEYYIKNYKEEYEVSWDGLVRRKYGRETIYSVEEIDKVVVTMSPALSRNSNFHLSGFEAYNYGKVYLKNGEVLTITCLLVPKVEKALKALKGVKIERRVRLLCTLNLHRILKSI